MPINSNLPEDIIINILNQLPPNSVGRCRCVSKRWRFMLSKPQFIKTHLSKYHSQSLLVISKSGSLFFFHLRNAHQLFDEMTVPAKKLSFANHPDTWAEILASCDGLILVEDKQRKTFLINPITLEIREVRASPFIPDHVSYTMYGIGYDSASDDYKVVTLSYFSDDAEIDSDDEDGFVNVYSVRNGTWKKIENSPYAHVFADNASGVFANGCIHWITVRITDHSPAIMGVDLAEEKLCEVPPPSSYTERFPRALAALGRSLCLPLWNSNRGSDVWMMKEYGVEESWTKFTIMHPEELDFRPFCLLGQKELVLVQDEDSCDEKLVMYDMKNQTFKDIVVHGIPDGFGIGYPDCRSVATFVESLVSPYWGCEIGTVG